MTKGKLLAEIAEEPKTKTMLNSIFTRLSLLLQSLADMEKITSQTLTLDKENVSIEELILHASNLLYIDVPPCHNIKDVFMEADFYMMSMVFKNLIENGLKYGDDLEVVLEEKQLTFVSKGKKLDKDLSYYTEAFSKGNMLENSHGFGLGLYLVKAILEKHGMDLAYSYAEDKNRFSIVFNKAFITKP